MSEFSRWRAHMEQAFAAFHIASIATRGQTIVAIAGWFMHNGRAANDR